MKDTLDIQCLVEALDAYNEAAAEERKARDEYEGYSWGYHGQYFIERREKAAERFQETLDAYIDARIAERLSK